jgi:hypothetical protein
MLKFREFSVSIDATPKPIGDVTIPAGLAGTMVEELRRMLLAHEDGRPFVVDVTFTEGRPAVMGIQRVGNSACAASGLDTNSCWPSRSSLADWTQPRTTPPWPW